MICSFATAFAQTSGQDCDCPYPILFLHGMGSDESKFAPVAKEIAALYGESIDVDPYSLPPSSKPYVYLVNANVNQGTEIFGGDGPDGDVYINDDIAHHNQFVNVPIIEDRCVYLYSTATTVVDAGGGVFVEPENYEVNGRSESSQSGIMKYGPLLQRAIQEILRVTGKKKVILIGHSMGGLQAREYLQRRSSSGTPGQWWADQSDVVMGHRVAKLITLGTPHGGSNFASEVGGPISTNAGDIAGSNPRSEAARDLRRYFKGDYFFGQNPQLEDKYGVYLYGGEENNLNTDQRLFHNFDVDEDGVFGSVLGLNQRPGGAVVLRDFDDVLPSGIMPIPSNVKISFGVSSFPGIDGDIVVGANYQWLHSGDGKFSGVSFFMNEHFPMPFKNRNYYQSDVIYLGNLYHGHEPEATNSILRGIDEGDTPEFAFELNADTWYKGFANQRAEKVAINSNRSVNGVDNLPEVDSDWFYIDLEGFGAGASVNFKSPSTATVSYTVELFTETSALTDIAGNSQTANLSSVVAPGQQVSLALPSNFSQSSSRWYVRVTGNYDGNFSDMPEEEWRNPYELRVTQGILVSSEVLITNPWVLEGRTAGECVTIDYSLATQGNVVAELKYTQYGIEHVEAFHYAEGISAGDHQVELCLPARSISNAVVKIYKEIVNGPNPSSQSFPFSTAINPSSPSLKVMVKDRQIEYYAGQSITLIWPRPTTGLFDWKIDRYEDSQLVESDISYELLGTPASGYEFAKVEIPRNVGGFVQFKLHTTSNSLVAFSSLLPVPSSCSDGVLNGLEDQIDCGGYCEPCGCAGAVPSTTSLPPLAFPMMGYQDSYHPNYYQFGSNWVHGSCGGQVKKHTGWDIAAANNPESTVGAVVYPVYEGRVVSAYYSSRWKWNVTVEHEYNGLKFTSNYNHLDAEISEGEWVTIGTRLGTIAKLSQFSHLHYSLRLGEYIAGTSYRGALPAIPNTGPCECNDGIRLDPVWPDLFIDPRTAPTYVNSSTEWNGYSASGNLSSGSNTSARAVASQSTTVTPPISSSSLLEGIEQVGYVFTNNSARPFTSDLVLSLHRKDDYYNIIKDLVYFADTTIAAGQSIDLVDSSYYYHPGEYMLVLKHRLPGTTDWIVITEGTNDLNPYPFEVIDDSSVSDSLIVRMSQPIEVSDTLSVEVGDSIHFELQNISNELFVGWAAVAIRSNNNQYAERLARVPISLDPVGGASVKDFSVPIEVSNEAFEGGYKISVHLETSSTFIAIDDAVYATRVPVFVRNTAPPVGLPSIAYNSANFGQVDLGETHYRTFNVSLSALASQPVSGSVTGGASPFAEEFTSNLFSLAPGGLASFQYSLSSAQAGSYTDTLKFFLDGESSPFAIVPISGTVNPAGCSVPVVVTATPTNPTCAGNDGVVSLNIQSSASQLDILWDPIPGRSGQLDTRVIRSLTAGTYRAVVTNNLGCQGVVEVTLVNPPNSLQITGFTTTNSNCNSASGTVDVHTSGGQPFYVSSINQTGPHFQYTWRGGGARCSTPSVSGADSSRCSLRPGTYSVTVEDDTGCRVTGSYTIQSNGIYPTVAVSTVAPETCADREDAKVSIVTTGGTLPYSVSWNPYGYYGPGFSRTGTGASVVFSDLTPATYNYEVIDGAGCIIQQQHTIEPTLPIAFEVTSTDEECGILGSANVNVIYPSQGAITYWSTGDTSQSVSGLRSGTYNATVLDSNGCRSSQSFVIDDVNEFSVDFVGVGFGEKLHVTAIAYNSEDFEYTVNGTPYYAAEGSFSVMDTVPLTICLESSSACGTRQTCKNFPARIPGVSAMSAESITLIGNHPDYDMNIQRVIPDGVGGYFLVGSAYRRPFDSWNRSFLLARVTGDGIVLWSKVADFVNRSRSVQQAALSDGVLHLLVKERQEERPDRLSFVGVDLNGNTLFSKLTSETSYANIEAGFALSGGRVVFAGTDLIEVTRNGVARKFDLSVTESNFRIYSATQRPDGSIDLVGSSSSSSSSNATRYINFVHLDTDLNVLSSRKYIGAGRSDWAVQKVNGIWGNIGNYGDSAVYTAAIWEKNRQSSSDPRQYCITAERNGKPFNNEGHIYTLPTTTNSSFYTNRGSYFEGDSVFVASFQKQGSDTVDVYRFNASLNLSTKSRYSFEDLGNLNVGRFRTAGAIQRQGDGLNPINTIWPDLTTSFFCDTTIVEGQTTLPYVSYDYVQDAPLSISETYLVVYDRQDVLLAADLVPAAGCDSCDVYADFELAPTQLCERSEFTLTAEYAGGRSYWYVAGDTLQGRNVNVVLDTIGNIPFVHEIRKGMACVARDTVWQSVSGRNGLLALVAKQDVSCYQGDDGLIAVTPFFGTAPYSYEWEDGSSQQIRAGLVAGSYPVGISDVNGCVIDTVILIQEPLKPLSLTVLAPASCRLPALTNLVSNVGVIEGVPTDSMYFGDHVQIFIDSISGCRWIDTIEVGVTPFAIIDTFLNDNTLFPHFGSNYTSQSALSASGTLYLVSADSLQAVSSLTLQRPLIDFVPIGNIVHTLEGYPGSNAAVYSYDLTSGSLIDSVISIAQVSEIFINDDRELFAVVNVSSGLDMYRIGYYRNGATGVFSAPLLRFSYSNLGDVIAADEKLIVFNENSNSVTLYEDHDYNPRGSNLLLPTTAVYPLTSLSRSGTFFFGVSGVGRNVITLYRMDHRNRLVFGGTDSLDFSVSNIQGDLNNLLVFDDNGVAFVYQVIQSQNSIEFVNPQGFPRVNSEGVFTFDERISVWPYAVPSKSFCTFKNEIDAVFVGLHVPIVSADVISGSRGCIGLDSTSLQVVGLGVPDQLVSFQWSTGDTSLSAIVSSSIGHINYDAVTKDGCHLSGSLDLLKGSALVSSLQLVDDYCAIPTGSIAIQVDSASGPYQSYLSDGRLFQDGMIDELEAGTYTVTTRDSLQCEIVDTVVVHDPGDSLSLEIQVNVLPRIFDTISITNLKAYPQFTNYVGQDTLVDFAWSNGVDYRNQYGVDAGRYSVTATDVNGCVEEASIVVETETRGPRLTSALMDLDSNFTMELGTLFTVGANTENYSDQNLYGWYGFVIGTDSVLYDQYSFQGRPPFIPPGLSGTTNGGDQYTVLTTDSAYIDVEMIYKNEFANVWQRVEPGQFENPIRVRQCRPIDSDNDGLLECDDCDDSDSRYGSERYFFADADGDGFVSDTDSMLACRPPIGFAERPLPGEQFDCDDSNALRAPGAREWCNGIDDNCDGQIDEDDTCCPIFGCGVSLSARLFLQGALPIGDSLMKTDIVGEPWFPMSEPFTALGYVRPDTTGEAMALDSFLLPTDTIVDWLLVQLRSAQHVDSVVATRAALLQRDGDVVDMDGRSPVYFPDVNLDSFFVYFIHRNHLAVRTLEKRLLDNYPESYDFRTPDSLLVATLNSFELQDSLLVLTAGDANGDGTVNAVDLNSSWRMQNGSTPAYPNDADFNLDGQVNAVDLNLYWRPNNSRTSNVQR